MSKRKPRPADGLRTTSRFESTCQLPGPAQWSQDRNQRFF